MVLRAKGEIESSPGGTVDPGFRVEEAWTYPSEDATILDAEDASLADF